MVGRVEALEEQGVLDVGPRAFVPVVVVVPAVEDMRLELGAGEGGVQQVVRDIAHVPVAAVVRRGAGDGIEGVHELVHGDDGTKRAPLRLAGLEEDDCDAGQSPDGVSPTPQTSKSGACCCTGPS